MPKTIQFDRAATDRAGNLILHTVDRENFIAARRFVMEQKNRVYDADLYEHRDKRSLDANKYAWELMGQIADTLRMDKGYIYVEMLKRYGQGGAATIQAVDARKFERTTKYWEKIAERKINGVPCVLYRFWVGSSQYDTQEMSIFIDGIVEEAKQLDIETLTPAEIARITSVWK